MKTADGSFHYCYNAQAVVDEDNQVVVAAKPVGVVYEGAVTSSIRR